MKRSCLQRKMNASNQADMILPENVEVKKIPKDLLDKCNFESEV